MVRFKCKAIVLSVSFLLCLFYFTPGFTTDFNKPLKSPTNSADYIIITTNQFKDAIQPLIELRESQGLHIFLANFADVISEFNEAPSPDQAIRYFVSYALSNWQTPPSYLLLCGDVDIIPAIYENTIIDDEDPVPLTNCMPSA
ncbi:hypothetical protein JW960_03310 [candidate division KSB1 bacterium]|nr:hypothetical protein [candidate division KSB1 bacterium]